jgi:hypothetical protein
MDETIECRVDGEMRSVSLYNLSCGGCMIEIAGDSVQKGSDIVVRLGRGFDLPGRIVWRIEKNAGVKFDAPLHPSVVERLGYTDEDDFDRNDPRDRFGIPLVERLHMAAGYRDA